MRVHAATTFLSLALPMAPAVADEATDAPEPVVLELSHSGGIRIPVAVNAGIPATFLLDTGSTHTVVSPELVERLGISPVARTRVLTPAGAQEALVVRLERMSIGSAAVSGLMPSVISLARLREAEPGVDGIVGQDFLSAFDFTIDYRRKRLRWTVDPDDGPARLPLVRAGERSLVQLAGNGCAQPVVMVPDSGAGGLVLFERDGRTAVETRGRGGATVAGLGSPRLARGAVLRELRVGPITLRDEPAVVVASDGTRALEGDGLLPLHRFSSVGFKNSGGYLVVRR